EDRRHRADRDDEADPVDGAHALVALAEIGDLDRRWVGTHRRGLFRQGERAACYKGGDALDQPARRLPAGAAGPFWEKPSIMLDRVQPVIGVAPRVRLDTLVRLRWLAIAGQTAAVLIVGF